MSGLKISKPVTPEPRDYFLVSQEDLYRIDSMIGALNLAITEILERRPVRERFQEDTPAQWAYDEQVNAVIHWDDPIEF